MFPEYSKGFDKDNLNPFKVKYPSNNRKSKET